MTIDQLEKNLDRIHEWVKGADQKVSIFIAFEGLLFGFIISWIGNLIKNYQIQNYACLSVIFIIAIGCFIYSLLKSLSAIIPRLKNKTGHSIMYFGDIAKMNLKEYKSLINSTTSSKYEDELITQSHISSKIAYRKHQAFKDSIILFLISMFLLAAGYMILISKLYV